MLFHGLGGKHQDMEPLATAFLAPAGYASLMCDARGHGTSGGLFGLDGPTDVADTQFLFNWLTARPEISDTQIGALGISLGGGAVWNAAVAGVPFKAIVPTITWTSLTTALAPQGLSKSGLVVLLVAARPDGAVGSGASRRGSGADVELEHRAGGGTRRAALAADASLVADGADAADPGQARLPLRHRPGRGGVQAAEGPEAALRRRPRPLAGAEPAGRAADVLRRGGPVVRPLPQGHGERDRQEAAGRARARSVGRIDDELRRAAADEVHERRAPRHDDDAEPRREGPARRAADRRAARDVRRLDRHRPLLRREELGPARRGPHRRRQQHADQRGRHEDQRDERRRDDPPDERERARSRGQAARRHDRRDLDGAEQRERALSRRRPARLVDHDRPDDAEAVGPPRRRSRGDPRARRRRGRPPRCSPFPRPARATPPTPA